MGAGVRVNVLKINIGMDIKEIALMTIRTESNFLIYNLKITIVIYDIW
jgi:hypothetical protein